MMKFSKFIEELEVLVAVADVGLFDFEFEVVDDASKGFFDLFEGVFFLFFLHRIFHNKDKIG